MSESKNVLQSKTVGFNVIVTAAISIASYFGLDIPTELATGIFAIGNFILRLVTKEAVNFK